MPKNGLIDKRKDEKRCQCPPFLCPRGPSIPHHSGSRLSGIPVLRRSVHFQIPKLNLFQPTVPLPLTVVGWWCLAQFIETFLGPRSAPGSPSIAPSVPARSYRVISHRSVIARPFAVPDGSHSHAPTAGVEDRGQKDSNDQTDEWKDGVGEWFVHEGPARIVIRHVGRDRVASVLV